MSDRMCSSNPCAGIARWPCCLLVLAAFGAWLARKQYRHTRWRLDDDGFALRRGRLWQRETRVPATRVQHLDLKRGPLRTPLPPGDAGRAHRRHAPQRGQRAGLDADDAERLRDRLARQIDDDDGR